ncbi:hypothetical protein KKA14_14560 [bacterium]|nr:hypothetical protein [bacterium]
MKSSLLMVLGFFTSLLFLSSVIFVFDASSQEKKITNLFRDIVTYYNVLIDARNEEKVLNDRRVKVTSDPTSQRIVFDDRLEISFNQKSDSATLSLVDGQEARTLVLVDYINKTITLIDRKNQKIKGSIKQFYNKKIQFESILQEEKSKNVEEMHFTALKSVLANTELIYIAIMSSY